MKGDQSFVGLSLKRIVAPFRQSAVAQIAFQTFYHPFHGSSLSHNPLKSCGHRRIPGIDMGKHVEGYGDCPPVVRMRAAFRPVCTVQADRCAILVGGSLIYERAGAVPHSLIFRLMVSPACQGSARCEAFHAAGKPLCHRADSPGTERSHENYAEIFQEIVFQPLITAGTVVKGDIEPRADFREIFKKSPDMGEKVAPAGLTNPEKKDLRGFRNLGGLMGYLFEFFLAHQFYKMVALRKMRKNVARRGHLSNRSKNPSSKASIGRLERATHRR